MHELTVIGAESDALLLEGAAGEKFTVSIDENLRSALRGARSTDAVTAPRPGPREIQAHIRAGMSANDVASITGAPIEYIQKFEGPVLAEREFVIESALAVPVTTAADTDASAEPRTFGSVIKSRLADLGATAVRWASWKEPEAGWVVKLAFTADSIDHDARWSFEPRKSTLVPANNEATTLSQQGDTPVGLIPRLRAVAPEVKSPDESRFDSGAFHDEELGLPDTQPHPGPTPVVSIGVHGPSVPLSDSADGVAPSSQTADLLDALRRRRGERESANFDHEEFAPGELGNDSAPGLTILDLPLDDEPTPEQSRFAPPPQPKARKGRVAMPSWDEIVFGAKPDDDP
ncbi:MAG TPA: septation protein SepH, partial [Terrimesophilobacter sp.]|nr:septation protein SepH [Terrimesophilobacter sp.]